MTDLITFPDKNGKSTVYTGGYINGIYRYLEMIGDPTTFNTSGHRSHHFAPSCSINNYAETPHPVITALCTRQKSTCEFCGIIGHKYDACIIRDPKFLSPSLRRKMNQFNALHVDEATETPGE